MQQKKHGSFVSKTKAIKTAKQAQGTLIKVITMMEDGEYCPNVIQQIESVQGLLKTTKRELLAGHLDTCVAHELIDNKKKAIEELLKIYNLSQ